MTVRRPPGSQRMQEFGREERVGAEIHRELSKLIREEIRDPRIGLVTIQEVRVSRDLSHAKVFFTLLNEEHARETTEALSHAASFLRRKLGAVIKLRSIPELHFEYDTSLDHGNRLAALIDGAVSSESAQDED